jgi:hypothetical protein
MRRAWPLVMLAACGPGEDRSPRWQAPLSDLPGALLRVWGTSATDVWAVGADADGLGPMIVHFDGERWERLDSGAHGDLWWIDQVGDRLRMVGERGQIVDRASDGTFAVRAAPTEHNLFGIWSSGVETYYVGGQPGGSGIAFVEDATGLRPILTSSSVLFKVVGVGGRVTMVGGNGTILEVTAGGTIDRSLGGSSPLLTVHGTRADALYAVGGFGSGIITRFDGARWIDETPSEAPGLNGVYAVSAEEAWAAGFNGRIFHRTNGAWAELPETLPTYLDLHSIWIDPDGGVWASGGQLVADPPSAGVLLYYGPPIASGL